MRIIGVVLAGGKSTRMGVDKKHLLYKEQSFLGIALRNLEDIDCDKIFISGYEANLDNIGYVKDEYQDIGAISGIYSSLKSILLNDNDIIVFLPCDMPKITYKIIIPLIEIARETSKTFYFYQHYIFPLIIKYNEEIIESISESIKSKQYSLKKLIDKNTSFKLVYQENKEDLININYFNEYQKL